MIAYLEGSEFSGSEFSGSEFSESEFSGSEFSGCCLWTWRDHNYGLRNRSKLFRGNTNIENWIPDIENSLSISDIRWPNHGIENHTNWNRGRKIECRHRSLVLNYLETQEKQHFPCRNSCPWGIHQFGVVGNDLSSRTFHFLNPANQRYLWRV